MIPATMDGGKVESGTIEVRLKSILLLRGGLNSEKQDHRGSFPEFPEFCLHVHVSFHPFELIKASLHSSTLIHYLYVAPRQLLDVLPDEMFGAAENGSRSRDFMTIRAFNYT